jgi:AbrB family looped-hinge helix DNA binding protein
MKTTIDRAGRLVVPKKIREAARIEPGTELEVSLVGDVIELKPLSHAVRLEERGALLVAIPAEPAGTLTQEQVNAAQRAVRERDARVSFQKRGQEEKR